MEQDYVDCRKVKADLAEVFFDRLAVDLYLVLTNTLKSLT